MTDVKSVQKDLLQLLKEFDLVCREGHVNYSLHGGSMLGAVREHGFIPWDDDIDTAMSRENFEKLQKALIGNNAYHVVGGIKKQFRRINDSTTWIDIFICDFISEKRFEQNIKLELLTILDVMDRDPETVKLSNLSKYSHIKQLAFKLIYSFGKLQTKESKVSKYQIISEKKYCGNRTLSFRSNDQYKGRKEVFPSSWLSSYIYVPFEDTEMPIIKNYHNILVMSYGENYMTPIKDTRNSDVHNLVRSGKELKL